MTSKKTLYLAKKGDDENLSERRLLDPAVITPSCFVVNGIVAAFIVSLSDFSGASFVMVGMIPAR